MHGLHFLTKEKNLNLADYVLCFLFLSPKRKKYVDECSGVISGENTVSMQHIQTGLVVFALLDAPKTFKNKNHTLKLSK